MPLKWEWDGFQALDGTLVALSHFDAYPLMERFEDIIVEQNRVGVLGGQDGFGNPAPELKYRGGFGVKTAKRQVPNFGTTRYETSGFGPLITGLHDNLSAAQYRQLDGPRLAPRRDASRIIKNLHTRVDIDPSTSTWTAVGAWADVVDVNGKSFLEYHFNGDGRNPRYDLRPVREWARQFALNALKAHMLAEYLSRF